MPLCNGVGRSADQQRDMVHRVRGQKGADPNTLGSRHPRQIIVAAWKERNRVDEFLGISPVIGTVVRRRSRYLLRDRLLLVRTLQV